MAVVIETTMGCLTVDLFVEERPLTCTNFLKLCKMKYYNFCLFHSVQNNFIAQTGDPTGTGNGGESIFSMVHGEKAKYYEAEAMPKIKHSRAGLVSMVNCGNNMLGSQFFFTLGDELHSLDGEHCVFGEVTEGLDVLIQLKEVICDEDHHPFRDIRITHTVILEDPFDDPPNMTFPDSSPGPTKERLMNGRIAPDEEVDDTIGKTIEEVEEMVQKREAQARATILEIVGDIPDADVAPPENILFVCKLNPVTTDEDLEIIFGRFGIVKSCEVIRDKANGDSLQYAFIEFEDKKACENAYFKMDNVLIDDRRIHVDFSQSVAKMRWKGKGKGVDYFPDNKEKEPRKRESKDQEIDKYNPKDRKSNRSRSRSPRQKWRAHEERTPENWDKYQDKTRVKGREEVGRRYEKTWDPSDGKSRDKSERYYSDKNKWHDYYGQRSYERSREDWSTECNYGWDKRHHREGREYYSHVRGGGFERTMESPETIKERERRNHGRSRLKAKECVSEDRKRTSKESFAASDKYFEDRERYGGRNERVAKEEKDDRNFYGETSRNDERKHGEWSYRQKREEKFYRNNTEGYRNEPDMSSENEERGDSERRRKRSEDREQSSNVDGVRRKSDEIRSNHERSGKFYEEVAGGRGRDNYGKEKIQEYKNVLADADSGGSIKYDGCHGGRLGKSDSAIKRSSDKKMSKQSAADATKHSWSISKVKKGQGSKVKKMQKRKRYSSSSSCCSDSSCSCGSSCFSSSSDSDMDSNSDGSESVSSSSTSPERRSKLKRKRNKKKVAAEAKKAKISKSVHRKKRSSSSESSGSSLDDSKAKVKHRKRKVTNSSSSEQKSQGLSRSKRQKMKKRPKKKLRRKDESLESSSEESSSSESVAQKKVSSLKKKKKSRKSIAVRKKNKKGKLSHKSRKADSTVSLKKKKKNNISESLSSSGVTDSESSKEEHKIRKDVAVKGKGTEVRGR